MLAHQLCHGGCLHLKIAFFEAGLNIFCGRLSEKKCDFVKLKNVFLKNLFVSNLTF